MSDPQIISPDAGRNLLANDSGRELVRAEVATAQLQAQAVAFEQAAFLVAERRPRDMDVVRQRLLRDCERSSFADSALYKKPVGGKTLTGLSVRYAEAALRHMGNARVKRFITLDDQFRRKVLIVVSDLETNTHFESEITLEKTVERKQLKAGQQALGSRKNSYGDTVYLVEATEDDMLTKESAVASKFIRQNALRIIPGDLQDECLDAINQTIAKKVDQDPDAEKKKLIDSFDDLGIRADQLKSYLGVDELSALTPKDLITLRGVYTAIRDGETNWRELTEQREAARGGESKPANSKTSEVLNKIHERKAASPADAVANLAAKAGVPLPAGVLTGKELFGNKTEPKGDESEPEKKN